MKLFNGWRSGVKQKSGNAITLRRFTWLMLTFITFQTCILMVIQFKQIAATIEYETTAPVKSALLSAKLPAAMSIEFLDKAFSDRVVDSLMGTGFFSSIRVVDDFGQLQSVSERPLLSSFWGDLAGWILEEKISYSGSIALTTTGTSAGRLEFTVDANNIAGERFRDFVEFCAVLLGPTAFGWAALFLLIRLRLVNSIRYLTDWLVRIYPGNENARPEPSKLYVAELAVVAAGISEMLDRLKASYESLTTQNERQLMIFSVMSETFDTTDNKLSLFDQSGGRLFSNVTAAEGDFVVALMQTPLDNPDGLHKCAEAHGAIAEVICKARLPPRAGLISPPMSPIMTAKAM